MLFTCQYTYIFPSLACSNVLRKTRIYHGMLEVLSLSTRRMSDKSRPLLQVPLELPSPTCQRTNQNLLFFTPPDVRSFSKQSEVREENTQVCVMSTTESNGRLAWNLIPLPTHSCGHYKRSLKEQYTQADYFLKTSQISLDLLFSSIVQKHLC